MSQTLLDAPASRSVAESVPTQNLAALTEKLAELRFVIILTARWEASSQVDLEEREVLRGDLLRLRKQYSGTIDEIAMTFGVQDAMDAQVDVEHRVQIPRHIAPSPFYCGAEEDGSDSQI